MKLTILRLILLASIALTITPFPSSGGDAPASDLIGLWQAQRNYGPEVSGVLDILHRSGQWSAHIAGFSAAAVVSGESVRFEIDAERGAFRGQLTANEETITGHWIQPATAANFVRFASPVNLTRQTSGHWQGDVVPSEDKMTFFLSLTKNEDGCIGGFLRNPEANFGRHFHIENVVRDGDRINFIESNMETVRLQGVPHPDDDTFSIYIPDAGGTFDFVRVSDDTTSPFYPRGRHPQPYTYSPPVSRDDGWQVASLEDVGMAVSAIEQMVQMIMDTPMDGIASPNIHSMLIARKGKLVVEEYFHGFTADTRHDTRSASKSVTATLVGLAIHAGEPVALSSPIYPIMYDGQLPPDLDPRAMRMTLEHLLTMTSGLACDDNKDDSPGAEWKMQSQTEQPDWLRFTLELPMVNEPGEHVAYCSASPNLAAGVLAKASGNWLPNLFQRYFARPMQMGSYHMNLTPTGQAYGGGGLQITGRDFLKMAQVYLDDGKWNGTKLLDDKWLREALHPANRMFKQGYGYGWWIMDFPYKDRTVQAFYAGGNGGQYSMGIPELDMAIVIFGGNYSQSVTHLAKNEHIPKYILRSVAEGEAKRR